MSPGAILRMAALFAASLLPFLASGAASQSPAAAPRSHAADRVEIVRTAYGVPHLRADDPEAMGYGLGWVQMEDYGQEVIRRLVSGRGQMAKHLGPSYLEGDFSGRMAVARAREIYHTLDPDVRGILEGFAAAVNAYVRNHPDRVQEWAPADFTGHDLAARDVSGWNRAGARTLLRRLGLDDSLVPGLPADEEEGVHPSDGSNGWALAPSRTRSGRAILLRNPHLAWDAGYYEGHVVIPGDIDFYGDFRIGGPFGTIGGFNRRLGWSTTNNAATTDQAYRLPLHPDRPDHVLFDGVAHPIVGEVVTAEVLREDGRLEPVSRTFLRTSLGPVIHRDDTTVVVYRSGSEGAHSRSEQFLRMMRATNRAEWEDAMRMRAITSSNYMYADADGDIMVVWNARLPAFPHEPAPDSILPARVSTDLWTHLVPWEALPRHLNPPGGYVQQANDTPHFDNLPGRLAADAVPYGVPEPRLRLRSQLSIRLVESMGDDLTLDEVFRWKNDLTMLAAERLKPDLLRAVRSAAAGEGASALEAAADLLESWDNTAASGARGAVLFDEWLRAYNRMTPDSLMWTEPWSDARPAETPAGLGSPERAVEALRQTMEAMTARWGSWDVAWGDVHRARLGAVDLPAPGCSNLAGCFRILEFRDTDDGLREVARGDGWVSIVEFTEPLSAKTILAYGQTADPESPHHTDQLALFLEGGAKPVLMEWAEVEAGAEKRYRPGR